ncbi:DEKNAAC100668 [Brettanomyces naardenensis]|uniref:DEKNAAC100668 n=1 Tax=Brettanomyces naardenensis TaxID=13370 RepID=A0A448YGE6_BRENA|nr:DEKNAAC100668 [Brettanomyces naardenensis]
MANTTSIAVGCAVGVPAVIVLSILFVLWNRQQRRMRKELASEAKSPQFADNECDLDLDDIIEDGSVASASHSEVIPHIEESSPSTLDQDLEKQKVSKKSHSKSSEKDRAYRNKPRIMGLRIVPRAQFIEESSSSSTSNGHGKTNSQTLVEQGSSSTEHNLTLNSNSANNVLSTPTKRNKHPQPQQSFINYYESVIPILPTAQGSLASSVSSSTNDLHGEEGTTIKNNNTGVAEDSLVQPAMPMSHENSKSSLSGHNKSLMSLQNDYIRKLNETDSSSFPKAAQTLVTATASQINLINNYPGHRSGVGSHPSRSNSSYSLSNQNVSSPMKYSRLYPSHSSLGIYYVGKDSDQSLLPNQRTDSESSVSENEHLSQANPSPPPRVPDKETVEKEEEEEEEQIEDRSVAHKIPHSSSPKMEAVEEGDDGRRSWVETSETYYQTPQLPERELKSPFDTPPRQSQYMSPGDPDEEDEEYSFVGTGHGRDLTSPHNDADEEFSNYAANKREWIQSVKSTF